MTITRVVEAAQGLQPPASSRKRLYLPNISSEFQDETIHQLTVGIVFGKYENVG